jgi:hypothetical protein
MAEDAYTYYTPCDSRAVTCWGGGGIDSDRTAASRRAPVGGGAFDEALSGGTSMTDDFTSEQLELFNVGFSLFTLITLYSITIGIDRKSHIRNTLQKYRI